MSQEWQLSLDPNPDCWLRMRIQIRNTVWRTPQFCNIIDSYIYITLQQKPDLYRIFLALAFIRSTYLTIIALVS